MARSSDIGALGAIARNSGDERPNIPQSNMPQSIGALARPSGNEPPPKDAAEFQARAKRNADWAQEPEVQAALLQFAINMMQPVGADGIMGNLSRGIGGAFQAASRVREGTLEEQKAAQELLMDERKMKVAEGGLSIAEQRLAIDQAELGLKLKKGTTKSVVVDGADPINETFKLGIPKGSKAKVEVTVDDNGKVTNASVEAGFEGGGGTKDTSSTMEQLQKDRAEALARGDKQSAAEIDLKIKTESAGESGVREGRILVPDPAKPGSFKEEIIPGSKADLEQKEADKVVDAKWAEGAVAAATVAIQTRKALEILDKNPMPNVTVTGLGGLIGLLPVPTDARALQTALQTIKSNATITTLTAMRQASPTGAAVGNVSDYEDRIMQSKMGTLDEYGDAQVLRENLHRVATTMRLIVDGDPIKKIGEQVKAGILTPEQGFIEVERLIDQDITKEAEQKAEMAREAERAAAMETQVSKPSATLMSPDTLSPTPGTMTMTTPTPEPRAVLSPEEQTQLNVLKQVDAIVSAAAEKGDPEPTMPLNLSESDQDTWQHLDVNERRVFLSALEESKKRKRKGSDPSGTRHQSVLPLVLSEQDTTDANALRLWDSTPVAPVPKNRPAIEIDPKTLGVNSPLRRK